jgi:D-alanyl-D-alanine carboxypeptidase
MSGLRVGASLRLRGGVCSFAAVFAALAIATAPSHARAPQKQPARFDLDNPRYASIVVDANTGATLRQANADSPRHPASLTKIMTLYLLFERIEAGKLKLSTPLAVSAEAASQAPTKLGLKPGQSITVEDAIKGLITKSANDAAVVIAETLAGSEENFAQLMTRRARALGMTRTIYRNASGLPDDEQLTTARDQARLGILIQERFPHFYRYFSLASFTYRGEAMRNHNHLLGKVAGVDGIKTGYTQASGYNLVTSVRRGGRHIVAVVMGGNTGAQRDANMRSLIERYIVEASLKRPEMNVAQAPEASEARAEVRPQPRTEKPGIPNIVIVPVIAPPTESATTFVPPTITASNAPLAANPVKTVPIRAGIIPLAIPSLNAYAQMPEYEGPALESARLPSPAAAQTVPPPEPPGAPAVTGNISAQSEPPAPAARAPRARGGWAIQIGAFEREDEATQRLNTARSKVADLLGSASPYTEKTTKGDKTFYRARIAGFDREQAEAVCKVLQRNDVACMALKI